MRSRRWGLLVLGLIGCRGGSYRDPTDGSLSLKPIRPNPLGPGKPAPPYTGSDPFVLQAQTQYITGMDLHQKFVMRTCAGVNGVCHNAKEYPDLHTLSTFTSAIGAPCNVQSGTPASVFDRCELLGDDFSLAGAAGIQTGWLEYIQGAYVDYQRQGTTPPDNATGLHLHLHDPVPGSNVRTYGSGQFVRTLLDQDGITHRLVIATYTTTYWILGDRTHLLADVQDYQLDEVQAVLDAKVQQGDLNRNGIYGYSLGKLVSLINPAKPEQSYLPSRLKGTMEGQTVPGTRMPLANQPPSVVDMLALMCFIQGLDPNAAAYNLADGINYRDCGYTSNPQALNVVGQGITFSGRIAPMLNANCGGCHGATNPPAGLDLASPGLHDRLLLASTQQPAKALISPGNPIASYLWLKVSGDGSISGLKMPLTSSGTPGQMPSDDLSALSTWISAGALND